MAMTNRLTRADVEAEAAELARALGRVWSPLTRIEGGWYLNYAAAYGGYKIVEVSSGGGEREPLRRGAAISP